MQRSAPATCAWLAALLLPAGCGDHVGLPAEPQAPGGFTGEIAYEWQYRWQNMPSFADMALASGILFAIDEDSARVRAYRSDRADPVVNLGFSFPRWIVVGSDTLRRPVQLAVGGNNTLWVGFADDRRVQEFRIGSPPQATGAWVAGKGITELGGLAVDPDGGFVYVSDSAANTVSEYRPSTNGGSRVAVLSTEGRGDTFVIEPRGLFFFNDSLLVADRGNNRVQVIHAHKPFTGRGEVRDPLGEPLGLRAPVDVWVDRAGMFYVAENGRVTQVSPAGEIKEEVTERDPESAQAPKTVVANATQVWVPDAERRRLTVYQINTVAENLP